MICFNVICRTYNYIVFSDFNFSSHSPSHFDSFPSFLCKVWRSRDEEFCPVTFVPIKVVCLWAHTRKCGKLPSHLLNSSDGPDLPSDVINRLSPMNSDDSWWWWTYMVSRQHDLTSPHVGNIWLLPCHGSFPSFPWILESLPLYNCFHLPHLCNSLACTIPHMKSDHINNNTSTLYQYIFVSYSWLTILLCIFIGIF